MEQEDYSFFTREYIRNPYFCKIETSFMADKFNLAGIEFYARNQADALSIILSGTSKDISCKSRQQMEEATIIYGMIHARYILTSAGLSQIGAKYDRGVYGYCPRVHCSNQKLLPLGLCSLPNVAAISHYCCSCEDVYSLPWMHNSFPSADSAFFGRTYVYLFFKKYPHKLPTTKLETYIPRIYGFKVKKYSDEDKVRKELRDAVEAQIKSYEETTESK